MFDFKAELIKLARPEPDPAFMDRKDEISAAFAAFNGTLTKFNKKQGAIEMQVEELYAFLEEQKEQQERQHEAGQKRQQEQAIREEAAERENGQLVQALIVAADLIEDFHAYAAESGNRQLSDQAGLMWRALAKELARVGLCRIADEHTPFNAQLNHLEGVAAAGDGPEGMIASVLRSGYMYRNKVYRKSGVIVKKTEENREERTNG